MMLEKMLDDIKKAEKTETDHYNLQHFAHQRQTCEKNLLSVRQNLAEASKVRIWQDLQMLLVV